jgi:hypothetical protein
VNSPAITVQKSDVARECTKAKYNIINLRRLPKEASCKKGLLGIFHSRGQANMIIPRKVEEAFARRPTGEPGGSLKRSLF